MNVRVARYAGKPIFGMHAVGKLLGFVTVAAGTIDLFKLGVASHVLLQISTLQMATGAAVFAMGGAGKTFQRDLVAVATKTVLRIVGHFVHDCMGHARQHEQH